MKRLFEDFVPVSHEEALITTGWTLDALDQIELAGYSIDQHGRVFVDRDDTFILKTGLHLRLGGMNQDKRLLYSDGGNVYFSDARLELPAGAHQPCVHNGSIYYTKDLPHVRIYRDDRLFLDHFGQMIQVGNPCFADDGTLYFEARDTDNPTAVTAWQVWRLRVGSTFPEFVCIGANPAWYAGKLFAGTWNGRGFSYRTITN